MPREKAYLKRRNPGPPVVRFRLRFPTKYKAEMEHWGERYTTLSAHMCQAIQTPDRQRSSSRSSAMDHFGSDTGDSLSPRHRRAQSRAGNSLVEIISSIRVTAIDNAPDKTANPAETKQLVTLSTFLREFLDYPDKQIESAVKLKLAVLSLGDVVLHSRGKVLETEESGLNNSDDWDDTECADMNVVKLPYLHLFHEDCLLEWLHSNILCPMCREEPITADAVCSTLDDEAPPPH
ncbi:hypothetical protein PsorP6_007932 [Peronosclerospora sorghi]|uniref:Uncharacterized protein n=1 Tax=Peronosclerospora sorghi TaxID=230839 RepID=A0ACC0WAR2_9STRA|nr:hypothetical protein PsorP6_007932 [Peronosclerospora sorghi]